MNNLCLKRSKNIQWGKESLFYKCCWENLTTTWKKNEIRLLPNTIHKDKLKMDGKHRQNTLCHKSRQDLLSPTSYSSRKKKKKIMKWDIIKLKSLSTAKEIINKVKTQCSEWEK